MVAIANAGQFLGAKGFRMMAGKYYTPPHLFLRNITDSFSTTASRYYVVPFIIEYPVTIAGAWCYNGGTGDSGDKFKMALYEEAQTGGPGAMVKSFGEGTFGASAAINNLVSSYSASPGRYYLEFVTDNAVTMLMMTSFIQVTVAGYLTPNSAAMTLGFASPPSLSDNQNTTPVGDYVGGTYANFPEATSLTLTNTLTGVSVFPMIGLKI